MSDPQSQPASARAIWKFGLCVVTALLLIAIAGFMALGTIREVIAIPLVVAAAPLLAACVNFRRAWLNAIISIPIALIFSVSMTVAGEQILMHRYIHYADGESLPIMLVLMVGAAFVIVPPLTWITANALRAPSFADWATKEGAKISGVAAALACIVAGGIAIRTCLPFTAAEQFTGEIETVVHLPDGAIAVVRGASLGPFVDLPSATECQRGDRIHLIRMRRLTDQRLVAEDPLRCG